jgi:5-methyltetrahydrofolate--homocysteine methyltransferase
MVSGVVPLVEAGARIIGGCCGSTPDHIRAFRQALDAYERAHV